MKKVKRMKRAKGNTTLIAVLVMAILCTACGTKLPEAGDYAGADSASGSAAGNDSQADSDQTQKGTVKKAGLNDKYPYCNDRNLYTQEDCGYEIEQRWLDGTVVRKYTLNATEYQLIYVNNEEIFYTDVQEMDQHQLWRIPIDRRKDGDYLQTDKAERIAVPEEDDISSLYANENYIAYITDKWQYKEYDRKKNKTLTVDREGGGVYEDIMRSKDLMYMFDYGMTGNTVFLAKEGTGDWERGQVGIYAHEIGTEQVVQIDDLYIGRYESMAWHEKKLYYSGGWRRNEKGRYAKETETDDVWLYDAETGEKTRFITEEQLLACGNMKEIAWKEFYITEDRLYILAAEVTKQSLVGDYIVLSRALSGDAPVQCEKKLTKLLNRLEWLDADCVDFVEGKVLISSDRLRCYDLSKGTDKVIKKGDIEAAYWAYIAGVDTYGVCK